MENYYEHLLAPDGNQDFTAYIISMLDELNYGLVRIKISGKRVTNIQIMAENDQHTLSFEDCEILNEAIINYLEKNRLIRNKSIDLHSLIKDLKPLESKSTLKSNIPAGPLDLKWSSHKNNVRLVSPANKRNIDIIVVGTGLAGGSASVSYTHLTLPTKA